MSVGVAYLRIEYDHREDSLADVLQAMDDVPASVYVIEDSFKGLVGVAQAMLDEHYPADIFVGRDSPDSGVRFVTRLRDALAQVQR